MTAEHFSYWRGGGGGGGGGGLTSDLKWGALETLLLESLYFFGNIGGEGLSHPSPHAPRSLT